MSFKCERMCLGQGSVAGWVAGEVGVYLKCGRVDTTGQEVGVLRPSLVQIEVLTVRELSRIEPVQEILMQSKAVGRLGRVRLYVRQAGSEPKTEPPQVQLDETARLSSGRT